MSVPSSAAVTRERTADATGPADVLCRESARPAADAALTMTSLFPPRDADSHVRAAWLARSPWPEVVFASAH